jgi:hypothetical protein
MRDEIAFQNFEVKGDVRYLCGDRRTFRTDRNRSLTVVDLLESLEK